MRAHAPKLRPSDPLYNLVAGQRCAGLQIISRFARDPDNAKLLADASMHASRDVGTLSRIAQNFPLYTIIRENSIDMFDDFDDAISAHQADHPHATLVYFAILWLYVIVTPKQEADIFLRVSAGISNGVLNRNSTWEPLCNSEKSKFMFLNMHLAHRERIAAHVEKCFESYARPTESSFITNAAKTCKCGMDCDCNSPLLDPHGARAEYDKLVATMRAAGDDDLIESIIPVCRLATSAVTPVAKPRGRGKNQRK